jgi:hypothetical protein
MLPNTWKKSTWAMHAINGRSHWLDSKKCTPSS